MLKSRCDFYSVWKVISSSETHEFEDFDVYCNEWPILPIALKLSDEVLVWLSVWSKVQIVCIWSS